MKAEGDLAPINEVCKLKPEVTKNEKKRKISSEKNISKISNSNVRLSQKRRVSR